MKKLKIEAIAFSFINYGAYSERMQEKIFDTLYHYSIVDIRGKKSRKLLKMFNENVNPYLDKTLVNNSITLRKYLHLHFNTEDKLLEDIHSKYIYNKPIGRKLTVLPALFFVKDVDHPIQIQMEELKLSGDEVEKFEDFFRTHAKDYKDNLKDDFMVKYYSNIL